MKDSKTVAICKPEREASGKINPAASSIVSFQSPELCGHKFLLLKLLRLG